MSDPANTGLSLAQADEVMRLRQEYQSRVGHRVSDPDVWYRNHLALYLGLLALDAASEGHGPVTRRAAGMRRDSAHAFASYLEHQATAEDLISELSREITVPDFLAEAIRRDIPGFSGAR